MTPLGRCITDPALLDEAAADWLMRAQRLAGRTLKSLSDVDADAPGASLDARHKGAIGARIEHALGVPTTRSSTRAPDIEAAALEVKSFTLQAGRVSESLWVCSAVADEIATETWATSRVRQRLARVLFVPIDKGAVGDNADRGAFRVGTSFVFVIGTEGERILANDWHDLGMLVADGLGHAVTARRGSCLQLRPKGARGGETRKSDAHDDVAAQGFYLRQGVLQQLLDQAFASPIFADDNAR